MFVGSNNYSRFNARKPHPPIGNYQCVGVYPSFVNFLPSKNAKICTTQKFPSIRYFANEPNQHLLRSNYCFLARIVCYNYSFCNFIVANWSTLVKFAYVCCSNYIIVVLPPLPKNPGYAPDLCCHLCCKMKCCKMKWDQTHKFISSKVTKQVVTQSKRCTCKKKILGQKI